MGSLPEMIFLGYRVKRPWRLGPGQHPMEWVCCVGESLCEPPERWVDRWDFNRANCYASPDAAWATVAGDRAEYRLFAYDLLPLDVWDGESPEVKAVDEILHPGLPELPPSRLADDGLSELGYDVAEAQFGHLGFPHSPLVNNGFAHEFPTNRYALLDDLETAIRACEVINEQMPEHAPHWVFRVFGKDVGLTSG